MQIYKLMRRKDNVKYYFARNRVNSAESFILGDYGEKNEVLLAVVTHKGIKVEYNDEHFPPASKEIVDDIIKKLI